MLNKKNKQEKKYELVLIILFYFFASLFNLFIKADYLQTIFIFAGIPSIYLSIRKPQIISKTVLFTLFLGIPATFLIDYMGHASGSWFIPSVLGIRILNMFPLDSFIWAFFYGYFVVAFYEYFFDNDKKKNIFSANTKRLFYLLSVLLFVFAIVYSINKELLAINYFYIIFIVLFFIIPCLLVLSQYPRLLKKMFLQGLYFFLLSFIFELTALELGQWFFKSEQYIGFIEIFHKKFPLEELLWLILAVPALLCFYEYYVDDRK